MQIEVIDANKTAMIVVDMQNDFVASGAALETPAAREMVPKLAEALNICRDAQIKVIYTAHVHRRDGCDMGLFDDLHPPIAHRAALVDGTPGVDIYPELAPAHRRPPRHAGDPRGINGPCDVGRRHGGTYLATRLTPVVGHFVRMT